MLLYSILKKIHVGYIDLKESGLPTRAEGRPQLMIQMYIFLTKLPCTCCSRLGTASQFIGPINHYRSSLRRVKLTPLRSIETQDTRSSCEPRHGNANNAYSSITKNASMGNPLMTSCMASRPREGYRPPCGDGSTPKAYIQTEGGFIGGRSSIYPAGSDTHRVCCYREIMWPARGQYYFEVFKQGLRAGRKTSSTEVTSTLRSPLRWNRHPHPRQDQNRQQVFFYPSNP